MHLHTSPWKIGECRSTASILFGIIIQPLTSLPAGPVSGQAHLMAVINGEQGFVYVSGKRLRRGYTTGSCAAAAAKAAAEVLLSGRPVVQVDLLTPRGIMLHLPIETLAQSDTSVTCAVRKDGGDDPDDTTGLQICATVALSERSGIVIEGGSGVGRVTRRGLDQPVGAAAINHVPRQMITAAVAEVCARFHCTAEMDVTVTIPDGERTAARTFNPRLGIVGGISVLGTSGIVEPMSEQALLDSIRTETKVFLAAGRRYLLVVPGNYGKDFVQAYPHLAATQPIECSNYLGEMLDLAVELGAGGILIVGNLGKLVKLAGGIMNTHSRNADCRMEILAANAILAGADVRTARLIMDCLSTDDALAILQEQGLLSATMDVLIPKLEFYMKHRINGVIDVGAVVFSSVYGLLGQTSSAPELIRHIEAGQ